MDCPVNIQKDKLLLIYGLEIFFSLKKILINWIGLLGETKPCLGVESK
jgi:hypothetical protein